MSSSLRNGGAVFAFTPHVPEGPVGPTIQFRALLTNISETHSPSWTGHRDMGRADPKYMYTEYGRSLSVDFRTVALYSGEDVTWIKTLNALSDMTRPHYLPGKGYNGVYTEIQIASLYDDIGILDNVSYSIDSDTPWSAADIPIVINVSISWLHVGFQKPQWNKSRYGFYPWSKDVGIGD